MAYDEDLACRFQSALTGTDGISEKRMMGGICFFHHGNMIGGADRAKSGERRFMFRVGKENEAEALNRDGAMPVAFGKRRMGGMVFVDEAVCDDKILKDWVALALRFVSALPPK